MNQPSASPTSTRRVCRRRRPVYTAQHVLLAVDLSHSTFHLVWVLTFAVRLACVLFLACTARLYWFVAHPYMSYYASLIGPSAVADFKPMSVGFALVATLHAFQVYKMVRFSVHYRALVLGPPPRSLGPDGDALCFRDWESRVRSPRVFLNSFIRDLTRVFFDRHGPFGVESALFHVRMLASDLVEIGSQTTQVYTASLLLAKVWLNNLYVTATVLNCWSTPLVHTLFGKLSAASERHAALERVVCLSVDFVLDAVSAMVLPLIIFGPYYAKFDFATYNFALENLYDDIWFANMVMENQQILAQTRWEFVWKMIPHLSIYCGLNSIRALLQPPRGDRSARVANAPPPRVSAAPEDLSEEQPAKVAVGDDASTSSLPPMHLSVLKSPSASRSLGRNPACRMTQYVMQLVLFVAGCGLLALHVGAAWRASTTHVVSCTTQTRPWFASKLSCSVVRHNCHTHNSSGVSNADLAMIEPTSVAALVFSHCPHMRVPSIVASFRNLLGIDFYNCTMDEWSVEAAITAAAHPRLTYIILVYVNMTRLPDGILQPLPKTMTDFELVGSNLTELPANLDELWHPMTVFYVEHTPLTAFPPALTRVQVDDLSLIGTQIDTLPEFAPNVAFVSLAMTHTPLRQLPEAIGNTHSIGFLALGHTQLHHLPQWMNDVAKTATQIFVHHTPFCASKSEQEIAESFSVAAVLSCVGDRDVRQGGKYPLAILAPMRLYFDPDMAMPAGL